MAPEHRGREGDVNADDLAKKGASTPFVGPEQLCGLGENVCKMRLIRGKEASKETKGPRKAEDILRDCERNRSGA